MSSLVKYVRIAYFMRIGILGGSFDPPHFGHILVARQVKEIMKLNEVWLMPYFAHNWDSTVSSASHRFAMTKLVEEKGIIVSDEEIKIEKKSYTIDTIRRLKSKYSHTFFWIIGSDVLKDFEKWKDYKNLTKEIEFFVFPRDGFSTPSKLPEGFTLVSSNELVTSNISSSIIRSRIMKKLSVNRLVSDKVMSYIQKHKLYKSL